VAAVAAAAAAEQWILPQYPSLMTELMCKQPIGWLAVHSAWLSALLDSFCFVFLYGVVAGIGGGGWGSKRGEQHPPFPC